MLMIILIFKLKIKKGIMNTIAKINLNKNVDVVDSQICLGVCLFSPSSEIWIPNASEHASAIAIVIIPPITANLEEVAEFNPIIKPKVVIIADVTPKLNPTFRECFIIMNSFLF